jgi:plasmid maintenance system antidote protein VapI
VAEPAQTRVVERRVRLVVEQLTRRVMLRLGELDLTTEELAGRMAISRPRLSLLIHSEELTAEAFDRLTAALEVDPSWWELPIAREFSQRPDPAGALLARVKTFSKG